MAAIVETYGLRPMGRQYVHLSTDPLIAQQAGKRKSKNPGILSIQAKRAHDEEGIAFYRGNDVV